MTKDLRNAIMQRCKTNRLLKDRTTKVKTLYSKQINIYLSSLHKNKRNFFEKLDYKIFEIKKAFHKESMSNKVDERICEKQNKLKCSSLSKRLTQF